MKILHVNSNFRFIGGTEQYLFTLCRELRKRSYENAVLFGGADPGHHEGVADQVIHIPDFDVFPGRRPRILRQLLNRVISETGPDLIYIHNIQNPHAVRILSESAPTIRFVHDHELYCPKTTRTLNGAPCTNRKHLICFINAFRGGGYRCMTRRRPGIIASKTRHMLLAHRCHGEVKRFVVASDHMKENLNSFGYPLERIEVIPYFTSVPEEPSPAADGREALFVGRISPEKGLDALIEVFTKLPERYHLRVIGDGHPDYVRHIMDTICTHGLENRIRLTGWMDNRDLNSAYLNAAVVVVSSTWPEPFGIIGIEAMANSRPVIAFDVGGVSDWLQDQETGFLVSAGDTETFASRLEQLLNDSKIRDRMGRQAFDYASANYTTARHMSSLLTVFEEVACHNARVRP